MAQSTWETLRRTDSEVLGLFKQLAQNGKWGAAPQLVVSVGNGAQDINIPIASVDTDENIKMLTSMRGSVALQLTLRNTQDGTQYLQLARANDKSTDRVNLNYRDNQPPAYSLGILPSVHESFPTHLLSDVVEKTIGADLARFYEAREAALLRMEGVTGRLIEDTDELRRKLEERFDQRVDTLEQETSQHRAQLDSVATAERSRLAEVEAALAAREAKLDDRASRHARRQLRADLQDVLKERGKEFRLTSGTSNKRVAVHALYSLLIVALLVADVFEFKQGTETPNLIRLALSVLATFTTFFLYIRWSDQWFRQHADEEFRLKRLSLDVDRASWVVETAMEWQDENESPIPSELLQRLSRDLFASGPASEPVRHPAEDVAAAVLRASSTLKVNIPGLGEATLDRGGVRKLQGALGSEES